MIGKLCRIGCVAIVALLLATAGVSGAAEDGFLGGVCRPDTPFPEFMPLWREGWKQFDERGERLVYARPGMPLGACLHVTITNPLSKPLEIQDVLLGGVSLRQAIAPEDPGHGRFSLYASSLQFSKLPREQLAILEEAGEPVWWKVEPATIAPKGMAEVVVRLRREPRVQRIDVGVVGEGLKISGVVEVGRAEPQIVGVSFSPGMDRAFLYVRVSRLGQRPQQVMIDGRDCSVNATLASDPSQSVLPIVFDLPEPLREGTFHTFDVITDDGLHARSGLRISRPDLAYGMWGGFGAGETIEEGGPKYLDNLYRHNINMIMAQYGGGVRKFVQSPQGQEMCRKLGISIMDNGPGGYPNQRYTFLHDEPDAKDVNSKSIPDIRKRLGSRGQWLVEMGREHPQKDPDTLQLLNIDNTFKPEQWYMYGQLPDVACADPYYQEQLRSVYHTNPGSVGAYTKPTYVYATGRIYGSACAPHPMHLILHSCAFHMPENPFRPPTPEEKRAELYYSIASGARGISFWWYSTGGRYHGLGSSDPDIHRLFTEIGLVGAEIRSAEPVLGRACPTDLPVEASDMVWVRPLLAGADSLALVIVNDNICSDRVGTIVQPIEKGSVRVKPPAWLDVQDVFEVTTTGTADIGWKKAPGLDISLGKLELTRLVIATSDRTLRGQIQKRYNKFAGRVAKLLAERQQSPPSRPSATAPPSANEAAASRPADAKGSLSPREARRAKKARTAP